jgi:DnaJ-class molecular chaperone
MPDDYYKILGVPQDASPEQVKNAYRDMALKYHPDKNHDADATKRMQEINIAYATLSNPDARKQYDLLYSTTFSQTKQSSYAHSDQNATTYTFNSQQTWQDLFDNIQRYNQYRTDSSEYGNTVKAEAVGHIIVDGLGLFFDWLSKR